MRLLVAFVVLLAAPAGAAAAPFGELPSQVTTELARCLRATGAPGELIRRSAAGAALLQAGASGFTQAAELTVEGDTDCPQAAARPGGAGIVAFPVLREAVGVEAVQVIQASIRDPGGAWGPVADVLAAPEISNGNPLATAVSDAGEALVAVTLQPDASRLEVRVARRARGGTFGAPQTLFRARTGHSREPTVQAGMSASGEAVVAWSFRSRAGGTRELWAAVAAPGAAFGAPVRVGEVQLGSPFALAVGAGGHALLAFATGTEIHVAERAPGAGFGAAAPVARAGDGVAVLPVAALDAAGGAVVAWERATDWHVEAVVRAAPGPFGAPATLARPVRLPIAPDLRAFMNGFAFVEEGEYGPSDSTPAGAASTPRAVIAAGGRALLTWSGPAGREGVWSTAPRSATLPLAGGPAEIRAHGAGIRDADSVTPLLASGGVPAVAWTDSTEEEGDSRIHLAVEGTATVAESGPRVRIRKLSARVLDSGDALRLRVTCSAPCEVRAQTGAGFGGANDALSLTRAGSGELRLSPELRPIAGLRGGPVRVRLRSGAPDARTATMRTLTPNLRRRSAPPLPRVVGAAARRAGDDVVVTWRTTRDAAVEDLFVFAATGVNTPAIGYAEPTGGPRSFRVRLRDVEPARYVSIFVSGELLSSLGRTRVRVRG